jgi:hypothetical protein
VWGICRVREEIEQAGWQAIWFVVYAAWIAVVWLPLIALLTAQHSMWVILLLPVTAMFATLLLKWRAMHVSATAPWYSGDEPRPELFASLEFPESWRVLLAAAGTSLALEIGIGLACSDHRWIAGCLFGAAVVYPLERWLDRAGQFDEATRVRAWSRISAGNSLVVWLLLVLALVPFMATYGWLSGWLVLQEHAAVSAIKARSTTTGHSRGYTGIILVQPRKPHEIVAPTTATTDSSSSDPKVIPFDGDYWYFKTVDAKPTPKTHVAQGSPIKNSIVSTDNDALLMEAHQSLAKPLSLTCCRSLRVDVTNADNRPGKISLEVILRNRDRADGAMPVSLGTAVLPTSTVSPMPLTRGPVDDKLTFELPRAARGKSFNEIAVRIKPERSRSLAGSRIAIKDFALQR